jgi:hypothetical protein
VYRPWSRRVHNHRRGSGAQRRPSEPRLRTSALRDYPQDALLQMSGRKITMSSVHHPIRSSGLRSYRPFWYCPLTSIHRTPGVNWCQELVN